MKPTPEFENAICSVWKTHLTANQRIHLWTRLKDSLIISSQDTPLVYYSSEGKSFELSLKAHHPWGCLGNDAYMEIQNPNNSPIQLMIIELKPQLSKSDRTFPSIPMN